MNDKRPIISIAGAGAIGSRVALGLAHTQVRFVLHDDDTIEAQNMGTSAYSFKDLGTMKVEALGGILFDHGVGEDDLVARTATISEGEQLTEHEPSLIVDCFDNPEARNTTHALGVPTLHVGVSASWDDEGGMTTHGEIMWDGDWPEMEVEFERGNGPCTNALGIPILRNVSNAAVNIIEHYLQTGEKLGGVVQADGKVTLWKQE